jgi:hypothetical protein
MLTKSTLRKLPLIVVRVFNAKMEATNHSMSAVSLEMTPPELGVPDFAEHRRFIRTFPKDRAERDCLRYLVDVMKASPEEQTAKKADLERFCRQQFRITAGSFDDYCWPEAIKASGANWDRSGRRPR